MHGLKNFATKNLISHSWQAQKFKTFYDLAYKSVFKYWKTEVSIKTKTDKFVTYSDEEILYDDENQWLLK